MKFIRKFYQDTGFIIGAVLFYLLTRLYHLSSLPIFTDEAIYTRWAQIAKQDANWRFISLTDGKQPLFIWISMVIMKFVNDPLLAGRFVSVMAGFGTCVGIFFLSEKIFRSKKVGLLASFLYLVYPFALVYDRIGLYDSLVACLSVWALYLEVVLVRRRRLDIALILGMVLGLGVLTKSSAFFSIYLLPLSLLIFEVKEKKRFSELLKWVTLAGISTVLAYAYYSVLRLSPFFHIIDEKNTIFVYPFSEWISHPLRFFTGNFQGMMNWVFIYMTFPIVFLVILSFIFGRKEYLREKLLLFGWFVLPFIALALFGKVLYPRFIFFMTIPLLPLASYSIRAIVRMLKLTVLKIIVLALIISVAVWSDFIILKDFAKAPIPRIDLEQYINGWPAGGGVKESVEFFRKEAQNQKIFIGTQGTFGLMPFALETYLVENKNITIQGIWPIDNKIPDNLLVSARKMPTYVLFYQPCLQCKSLGDAPQSWPLHLVKSYRRGVGDAYLSVYRVVIER